MRRGIVLGLFALAISSAGMAAALADDPPQGSVRHAALGEGVLLETVYIPPGEFFMGSTPEEKRWATGVEGGAQAGTEREQAIQGCRTDLNFASATVSGCWPCPSAI